MCLNNGSQVNRQQVHHIPQDSKGPRDGRQGPDWLELRIRVSGCELFLIIKAEDFVPEVLEKCSCYYKD